MVKELHTSLNPNSQHLLSGLYAVLNIHVDLEAIMASKYVIANNILNQNNPL